jgi:4-carboxymuconolactone decarboxylase
LLALAEGNRPEKEVELRMKHGRNFDMYHDRRSRAALLVMAAIAALLWCPLAAAQDRMPPVPAEKMTEAQKKAAAEFTAARGPISGPWAVILRSPEMLNRARALSDYLRFNSSLPPRLSEFVILMTAREWAQQYEWNAHYPLAMKGGLNPEIAKAVAEGRRPEKMAEDEAALYDFCLELHHNRSVSDATYARALAKFGEQGIVDMIGLSGWYTLVAMTLNTARTPLPANATPALAPFPR